MSPPGASTKAPKSSIRVEVAPDDPTRMTRAADAAATPADGGRGAGGRPIDRLRALYLDRVARYDDELGDGTGAEDILKRTSHYPELRIELDVPETLVIDGDLFERLFDIYAYHGWDGIRRVERAFYDSPDLYYDSADPQGPPRRFFTFTRNLLAMLVRDALAELERRAATRAIANLSVTAAGVSEAYIAKYDIERTETTTTVDDPDKGRVSRTVATHRFGNEEESKALFAALTEAVRQRAAYEDLLQDVARLRDHARQMRATAQRAREKGKPLSSEGQLTSELDLKEQQSQELQERAESWLNAMKAVIGINSPLGLLAMEGLKPGFGKPDMEDLLGATLFELYRTIDDLGAGIDPRVHRAAAVLAKAGIVREATTWSDVQAGRVPAAGPEAAVADAAVEGLADGERGWFPLLHEATLHQLVESGDIPRDSFAFVVFVHYVIALNDRLEVERKDEEASKAFWDRFSKVAAAASLLLLLMPAAGLAVVVARGVAVTVDVVLIAHTVSSVTQQLARLDQLRDRQLLEPNAFSVEMLGRIGELGIYRRQFVEDLSQRLLLEVLAIIGGTRWAPLKKLLTLRAYVQDVETLLADA